MAAKSILHSVIAVVLLSAAADDALVKTWSERIGKTATLLESKDYGQALSLANRSIAEMVEHLGPGDGSTKWFAVVLTHKALAHAGLGDQDLALWYWHCVVSMYPKVADTDLSSFGEAGAFLKEHTTPAPAARFAGDPTKGFVPPKIVKRVKPAYPRGAEDFFVSGDLVVQVVIGTDGRVKSPRIVKALEAPTLSYAALEAVRQWRFEPARVENKPVEVIYNLTVRYSGR